MNRIKAQVIQTYEFEDGTLHVAHITFTNPKNQAITYTAKLYFASPSNITMPITESEGKTFTIPAGGSITIDFPIVTPLLSPVTPSVIFCVCCTIAVNGVNLILFISNDDVVVNFIPAIEWGDIIWDLSLLDCDKDELYQYLITGYVAERWWLMDGAIRKELALKIINWWSVPLGSLYKVRYQYQDEWIEVIPKCTGNAAIRCAIFADNSIARPNEYYCKHDRIWHELATEPCFYLPAVYVTIDSSGFNHAIAALQIGEDPMDFNSWIFFQYDNPNIIPGNWQMPSPGKVWAFTPWLLTVHGCTGPSFAGWDI